MKICDLTQFYSPVSGGVKRYVAEKIAYIEGHTDASHLLIIPGERDERIVRGRAVLYTLRSPLLSRTSRYRALLRLGAVREILERERPAIIESGDPYQVAWKAISTGARLGIPVIGFYHSHFPEAYLRSVAKYFGAAATRGAMAAARRYVRALYNRFARTMVPSPALGRVLADWGVRNVETVDLGVNIDLFQPAPLTPDEAATTRAEFSVPPDARLLLYIGRLAHEKNTRTLFEAFRLLHRENPGRHHLFIVGDGLQRGAVSELRGETGAVTWLPYCSDTKTLARFYRTADLFVHPGVQETFGLVTLESQACGTPVVGIRGSYMDRIIFNDQRHWAEHNTPAALAQAIDATCRGDLPALGRDAGEAVRQRYSWNRAFERLFAIYEAAVSAHS